MASWFTYLIILSALTIGLTVQNIPNFDVQTFNDKIIWTNVDLSYTAQPQLTHALESLINGFGEALFSFLKWVAEWSAQNPTIPFKLLIVLTLFAVFAPLIIVLFKLSIIIFILVREYFQNKKEKKELNKYKRKKK